MNRTKPLLLIAICCLSAACTTDIKKYPFGMVNPNVSLEPLKRNEYTILGDVQGESEETTLFGFIPIHSGGNLLVNGSLGDKLHYFHSLGRVEQQALFNALEKQPMADGIIAVRIIKATRSGLAFLYSTKSVTIKGKAIRIRVDREATPAPAGTPGN